MGRVLVANFIVYYTATANYAPDGLKGSAAVNAVSEEDAKVLVMKKLLDRKYANIKIKRVESR